tara:strand:- start:117 stop:380 length:264 start_codon:yes stop_codon:yes gene_type:complete
MKNCKRKQTMSDCLLIKHVDAALSDSEFDEHLYSVLRAVSDTMPPQTAAYVEAQHAELMKKIEQLKQPIDAEVVAVRNPYFCDGCED